MTDTTEMLTERRVRDVTPSGFQTTLTDDNRLRSLDDVDAEDELKDIVQDFGNNTLTEMEIINFEVERLITSYLTPERTIELPGTGLEYSNGHIHAFAAQYKSSDDTPTGTIKDPRRAGSDDLVFTFATPQVYNTIVGAEEGDSEYVDNFIIEDVEAGDEVVLVGEEGYNSSSEGNLNLDDDERLFFTGDFIDVSSGKSIFNRQEWVNVDGQTEDYGPYDFLLSNRLSGSNISMGHGAYVKREAELHLKAYEDGNAEVWPVAYYMAPGHKAPDL